MLGLKGLEDVINVHPLFVHFPIALLLTSPAFYLLGAVFKKEPWLTAGKWTLIAGAVAAAFTVGTGLQAAETVSHGGGTHEIMMLHQYFGFAVLGLSAVLSLWALVSKQNLPQKGRMLFLVLMVVLGAVVVQGADLGGRMVFLNGVGVGRKSMMVEEAAGHDHGDHGHDSHSH